MTETMQSERPETSANAAETVAAPTVATSTPGGEAPAPREEPPEVEYRARPSWFVERLHFAAYITSYWLARLVGRRWTNAIFSTLSKLAGPIVGMSKRINANIDLVRPHFDRATRRRIAMGVYNNFSRTSYEYAFLDHLFRDAADSRVEGLEHFHAAREAAGGRMVVASAHFGNWEAIRAVAAREGAPLGLIYRAFNNKLVDQHVNARMRELGWPVFRKGATGGRRMFKHVRAGHGALILVDQRLGGAPIIDFMGRPAETSIAAAQLARTLKAPLITASAVRLPDDSFVVRFDPPVTPDRPDAMMAEVNRRIEGWIEETPEQWLWVHRRWKVRKSGTRKFDAHREADEAEGADQPSPLS